jgi:hypothetical protein
MSKNESERDRWMDALSSESKDETELMLLMLNIKDVLESLSLERSERGTKDSTVMSWRYLERWAHLKEQLTSSNSSRSLRQSGTCGMIRHSNHAMDKGFANGQG